MISKSKNTPWIIAGIVAVVGIIIYFFRKRSAVVTGTNGNYYTPKAGSIDVSLPQIAGNLGGGFWDSLNNVIPGILGNSNTPTLATNPIVTSGGNTVNPNSPLPQGKQLEEKDYLTRHPDVKNNWVDKGKGTGWDHFNVYGQAAGYRWGFYDRKVVSGTQAEQEASYLDRYPDVKNNWVNKGLGNGSDHYNQYGAAAGYLWGKVIETKISV